MPVTLQASLMMLLALFFFTTMGICIRLSSAFVPVIEIVFFRNILAVLIIAPVLIRQGPGSIRMNRPKLFFSRASINFIGMLSGFTAVTLIPLAEMTALSFTGPIFVTVGAALFLGEVIRIRRIMAIAVGFVALHGAAFYGVPVNDGTVTLERTEEAQPVPQDRVTPEGMLTVFDPMVPIHWNSPSFPSRWAWPGLSLPNGRTSGSGSAVR